MEKKRLIAYGIVLALITLILDQVSKNYIIQNLSGTDIVMKITPWMNFVLVWNKGITFGLLSNNSYSPIILALLAISLAIFLFIWLLNAEKMMIGLALGLVLGGAIGNIIDRIRFGAVVDFIDWHMMGYHWYTFNVADAGICTGVALLVYDSIKNDFKKPVSK